MKISTLFFVIASLIVELSFAGTLVLRGTVRDRGFVLQDPNSQVPKIVLQDESTVQVFIADIKKSSRVPQSVALNEKAVDFSSINGWKKLTNDQTITTSSYIKVEAP